MGNVVAEFELQGLPKMTNSQGHLHWRFKTQESKKWKKLVSEKCISLGINNLNLEKAQLTLTRYSEREPDFDGLVSGFKHVIDGLVECKLLVNDRISNVGQPRYIWERTKRNEGKIKVKIEKV